MRLSAWRCEGVWPSYPQFIVSLDALFAAYTGQMHRPGHSRSPFESADHPDEYVDLHASLHHQWERAAETWERIKSADEGHATTATMVLPGLAERCLEVAGRLHDPGLRADLIALASRFKERMAKIDLMARKPGRTKLGRGPAH